MSLSGDAALASARICLTHEEGSSLNDNAVLSLARICLTQEVEGGNLEQGTMLKPEELPHWVKGPILARRAAATWLAKRPVRCPDFKGKSLQMVDRFLEILYIFDGNAHEDSEVRVFVKDEWLIGKKMREAMLAKGKLIMLEKVRLYVQSMTKGDLEVKKVEPKSNQSASFAAAMATAPRCQS